MDSQGNKIGDREALCKNILDSSTDPLYPYRAHRVWEEGFKLNLPGWPKGNGPEKAISVRHKLTGPASDVR